MSEKGSKNVRNMVQKHWKIILAKNFRKTVQKHQKIDPNPRCHTIGPSPKMSEKF